MAKFSNTIAERDIHPQTRKPEVDTSIAETITAIGDNAMAAVSGKNDARLEKEILDEVDNFLDDFPAQTIF